MPRVESFGFRVEAPSLLVGFPLSMPKPRRWIVALPAKNESQRLEGAIAALDRAAAASDLGVSVLVLANDCVDDTADVARRAARKAQRLALSVEPRSLPPSLAHAGGARVSAVNDALRRFSAGAHDLLFTTDADARLRPDAFSRMESAFRRGADVVLAKIECIQDPFDPACELALRWALLRATWRHRVRQLVETVRTGAIPDPPLHDDYGGAGIAATVKAYRGLGGFAPVPAEEDLRFVRAADRSNLHVNRQSGAAVDVFTRVTGRADGGMAADIAACTAAVAKGLACVVENHKLTARRILRDPTHARAFATSVTEWEPVEDAIRGLDRAIAHYRGKAAALASSG